MIDDNKGLVTITLAELNHLRLCEEFLERSFDLIPCLDEQWEEFYKENCDE